MFAIQPALVVAVAISFVTSLHDDYCERDTNGVCKSRVDEADEEGPCFLEDHLDEKKAEDTKPEPKISEKTDYRAGYPDYARLTRLDGVKVGHVQEFDIDGYKFKVVTKSLKPLLFEVPDAITDDERMLIVEKALSPHTSGGLFSSIARGGLTPEDTFKPSKAKGKAFGPASLFENWDVNEDEQISKDEIIKFARNYHFLYLNESDVEDMLKTIGLQEWNDGFCSPQEFLLLNTLGMEDHFNIMSREHPKHRQRTSDQTWLPLAWEFDPVLFKIRERFGKLMKIPQRVLHGSEHMQVVRYGPGGHYHAHYDSETERAPQPCCHLTNTETVKSHAKCKLCRFMTIMTYLNDPEEGGETAFPAADNITFSDTAFRRRPVGDRPAEDYYNLSEHCHSANMVVRPKSRTAVVWYNHHVDKKSGWLGSMDEYSLHGGCDVKKGEKWISNLWLTAPYAGDENKLSMYSMEFLETTDYAGVL